ATGTVDWQATLLAGHHAVRGAEALLRSCPSGRMVACRRQLHTAADSVATAYDTLGALLRNGSRVDVPVPKLPPEEWPTDLGTDLYHLADIRVWLTGLTEDFARLA